MSSRAQQALLGPRSLNLMRGDIERVLHDALDTEVPIRYDTSVAAVSQTGERVLATLTDGE